MDLANLVPFREVWIKGPKNGKLSDTQRKDLAKKGIQVDSDGYCRVPPDRINGDIGIDYPYGSVPSASFSIYNDDDSIPGVVKPPIRPSAKVIQMYGVMVKIIGGYQGSGNYRPLFRGIIRQSSPEYADTGRNSMRFSCVSYSSKLATIKRNEVYPCAYRQDIKTTDEFGAQVRKPTKADDRSWAIKKTGQSLTLKTVIEKIIAGYDDISVGSIVTGIKDDKGQVIEPSFDGRDQELVQENLSDWDFLGNLASDYQADMWIDEDHKFYFISREAIKNESTDDSKIEKKSIKGIHFYYHRTDALGNPPALYYITPINFVQPWLPDCALPMKNPSYDLDAGTMMGGLTNVSTDSEGNMHAVGFRIEDATDDKGETKIGYDKYTLKKEMMFTKAAEDFISNFNLNTVTWEDCKQFWEKADVVHVDNSKSRANPPFLAGQPNLKFTTYGNIYVRQFGTYYCYNMGFGIEKDSGLDRCKLKLVSISYSLGGTFSMTLGYLAW